MDPVPVAGGTTQSEKGPNQEHIVKIVEHRRHTMRTKPGKHLSQEGITLARRVGEAMGPFDLVLTSTVPRAFETAIAMGFAVTGREDLLSTTGDAVDAEIAQQAATFAALAAAVRKKGAAWAFGQELERVLRETAERLPDGGRALIISHGGVLELSVVACLPDLNYAPWGPLCDYCEGAELRYGGGQWLSAEVLRVGGTAIG